MKKTNIIATLAIIALSATRVIALELNTTINKEMTQAINATVTQELASKTQKGQELPDYKSLNQQFIDKLEKAAAESNYQTRKECPNCVTSVKEIYNEVLENYQNLLKALSTITRYNEKNKKEIIRLIYVLDDSLSHIKYSYYDERSEYVDFLCKQDRYFLKAKDSVVNMRFLVKDDDSMSYLNCGSQEPVKIKAHTFWKYLNSPEYLEEVGQGFQSEANAGK